MDRRLLAAAYDRSAAGYDQRFRELQRPKFRAAAPFPEAPEGSLCVDAGGGTALFLEWAQEEQPQLLRARWLVLDASMGMLRIAKSRAPLLVVADLARPPLRPASCAVVCAFTSVLGDAPRALSQLSDLVAPGGALVVSFLKAEAPRELPLRLQKDVEAGQDRIFVLRKD